MATTITREILTEVLEQHATELKSAFEDMLKTALLPLKEGLREEKPKSLANMQKGQASSQRFATSPSPPSSNKVRTRAQAGMLSSKFAFHVEKATNFMATAPLSEKLGVVGDAVKQGARSSFKMVSGALPINQAYTYKSLQGTEASEASLLSSSQIEAEQSEFSNACPTESQRTEILDASQSPTPRTISTSRVSHKRHPTMIIELEEEEEGSEDSPEEPSLLLRLVKSKGFDLTVSSVITLNAVFVGLETDYMARHWSKQSPFGFLVFDLMSCVFFATEMVLRLLAFGRRFFTSATKRYMNLFDLACVAAQLGDVSLVLSHGMVRGSGSLLQNLRLFRFFRIARIFQSIPELQNLLNAIAHSMTSLLWTLVVLLLVVYFVAVILTQEVTAAKTSEFHNGDYSHDNADIEEYFGTLPRSVISLYAAVSDGLGWQQLTVPLKQYLKTSMIDVIFAMYMAFMLYAMLNIVTGHIVEAAIAVAQSEKRKNLGKSLRQMFDRVDKRDTGQIGLVDFNSFLVRDKEAKRLLQDIELDPYEAISVFSYLDKDHTKMVDTEELVQGCIKFRGAAKVSHVLAFMDEFQEHAVYVEKMLESIEYLAELSLQPAYKSEKSEKSTG